MARAGGGLKASARCSCEPCPLLATASRIGSRTGPASAKVPSRLHAADDEHPVAARNDRALRRIFRPPRPRQAQGDHEDAKALVQRESIERAADEPGRPVISSARRPLGSSRKAPDSVRPSKLTTRVSSTSRWRISRSIAPRSARRVTTPVSRPFSTTGTSPHSVAHSFSLRSSSVSSGRTEATSCATDAAAAAC